MNEDFVKTLDFTTECGPCQFSTWEGGVQVGCKLNRLPIYQRLGKTRDNLIEGKSSYTITTICNTFRDDEWAKDKQDSVKDVLEEIRVKLDVVIVVMDDVDIKLTIDSINAQSYPPSRVILVANNNWGFPKIRQNLAEINTESRIPVKIFDKSFSYEQCVDEGFKSVKSQYYLAIPGGKEIPHSLFTFFNDELNVYLKQISMVVGDGFGVFQRSLHKLVGGNQPAEIMDVVTPTLVDKIRFLSNQQNNKESILEL